MNNFLKKKIVSLVIFAGFLLIFNYTGVFSALWKTLDSTFTSYINNDGVPGSQFTYGYGYGDYGYGYGYGYRNYDY